MNYKKFVLSVALSTLFSFLPDSSFSDVVVSEEKRGFYVGTQYRVGVPNFSNFSAAETIPGLTKKIFALSYDATDITKETSFKQAYDPTYASSFNSFSGVMGCYFNSMRIEFEGSYSHFESERQFYREGSNNYKFFALSREETITSKKFVVLENNGVIDRSLNVNFCYDITRGDVPLAPYVCAGVGADYIKFLGISLPKFSYQVKFGVNYPVKSNIMLFGGGYYHKVVGSKYERVEIAYHPSIEEAPKITSASANLNTDHFGCEVGIRFAFIN
uniref:Omp-1-17 n=1 Tax=Ehrlichia ewingii TaxID=947 RepID=B1N6C0_9RICK|nr:Omp-1-17 [Ehrlichia ewingii]